MALHNALINFTPITDTISSKSFHKLSDICDNLMIHASLFRLFGPTQFIYSPTSTLMILIVPDFYGNPYDVKESQPEVVAAWRIAQKLWTRDYAGVYEAVRGFNWSPEAQTIVQSFSDLYTANMFHLLLSAYSTIDVKEAAIFLGMSENEAAKYVLQEGWTLDPASQMLTVKKQPVIREQKLDQSKLQRLTEYVFHLEH